VVRRAERLAVVDPVPGSFVATYLNRLSDLLWAAARAAEGDDHLLAREATTAAATKGTSSAAGTKRTTSGTTSGATAKGTTGTNSKERAT